MLLQARGARLFLTIALGLAVLPAVVHADPKGAKAPPAQKAAPKQTIDRALLEKRVAQLREIQRVFKQQAAKPAPANLTKQQADGYVAQTKWLSGVAEKATVLERDIGAVLEGGKKSTGGSKVTRMAQVNMQFLALQEATQMESRKFDTISRASKARHEISLNAVHNTK